MKIYKFITQISIAGCMLVGTPMLQGCMDNSLNDPLGKVSEEELGRDGFAANAFFLTLNSKMLQMPSSAQRKRR